MIQDLHQTNNNLLYNQSSREKGRKIGLTQIRDVN